MRLELLFAAAIAALCALPARADDKHPHPAPPKPAPAAPKPAQPKPEAPKPKPKPGPSEPADATPSPPAPRPAPAHVRVVHAARHAPDLLAKLDKDHDGKLSRDEAAAAPELARVFDEIDLDGDGFITREELARWKKSYAAHKPGGTISPSGLGL